jgi:putative hydrolase of the HAD superfamily
MIGVFFDIDGTLMDHAAAARAAGEELHRRVPEAAAETVDDFRAAWHTAQQRHFARYLAGALTFREQRRERVREVLGRPVDDAEADAVFAIFLRAYEANWRLFPDALPCIDVLGGAALGVISNGDAEQQRRKLQTLGLTERLRHVVISSEVGAAKPAPAIFHAACARAGTLPAQTLYVGDQLRGDVVAASGAGMVGVWLNRTGEPRTGEPVHEIGTLLDLPPLVEELGRRDSGR